MRCTVGGFYLLVQFTKSKQIKSLLSPRSGINNLLPEGQTDRLIVVKSWPKSCGAERRGNLILFRWPIIFIVLIRSIESPFVEFTAERYLIIRLESIKPFRLLLHYCHRNMTRHRSPSDHHHHLTS